ncbi:MULTISPECIES: PhnD/SsuA/transferrin family substrate-binding protein [unclassified Leptolyngbya]|uniref:phosphate/phosphite/phosphonate ABC transporter substrate-binding protein n=1 Tax=unclassified Leptolyngbya TaxID=2650499 RepID=UPI0018EF99A0|nr:MULTISPECIES: PhnD/SsuA/transferrin family substrate-binding protein [unclassified Leptolyngbya]
MRLVSYLAPNLFWFYKAVSDALQRSLRVDVHIAQGEFDPLDDPDLESDRYDLLFICGLPLMRFGQTAPHQLKPLVAPVMQAERYENNPIYFSDVVVRADCALHTWEDLAGTTFCYNDLGSNSGYNLMRYELLKQGQVQGFFRQVIQSGSHGRSLQWIVEGKADCAAIDSTVLEQAIQDKPELAKQLRVITSLGPSPMPPIAVSQRLGEQVIQAIQTVLLEPDVILREQIEQAKIQRFVPVDSNFYKPILEIYTTAHEMESYLIQSSVS